MLKRLWKRDVLGRNGGQKPLLRRRRRKPVRHTPLTSIDNAHDA